MTKASGTGLGLPIVLSLSAALGGRVAAFDHPEGGATFELVLPTDQLRHLALG